MTGTDESWDKRTTFDTYGHLFPDREEISSQLSTAAIGQLCVVYRTQIGLAGLTGFVDLRDRIGI